MSTCFLCKTTIRDRAMNVLSNGQSTHLNCLRCAACQRTLMHNEKCILSASGEVLCEEDFLRKHGLRCMRCNQFVRARTLIRRHENFTFHDNCFRCCTCNQSIAKNRFYAFLNGRIFCENHIQFLEQSIANIQNQPPPSLSNVRTRRGRTTFTEAQKQQLQAIFDENKHPDRNQRIQIANDLNLSPKTVRVWFQNRRCEHNRRQPPPDI